MVSQRAIVGGGICLVILNVVLLAVLLGVAVLRAPIKDRKENLDVHKYSSIVKQELGTVNRSSEISEILRVREDLADIYNRQGNLKKPAIHLVIGDIKKTENVQLLSWQSLSNTTFQGEGVTYHDGTVTVTHGGYYYIYSIIRYRGQGTAELDYGRILHSVLMKKESETEESPTILMRNLQSTPTIRRGKEAFVSSSLGATFYLHPNTKVMVTSSIPDNIDRDQFGSNFGLFLV